VLSCVSAERSSQNRGLILNVVHFSVDRRPVVRLCRDGILDIRVDAFEILKAHLQRLSLHLVVTE